MRKIKVVVLLVQQLQHGFTKNAKVSPNLTVAQVSTVPHSEGQSRIFIRYLRSREISRCPAFFENGIIIFFVADYSTCLPRNATK